MNNKIIFGILSLLLLFLSSCEDKVSWSTYELVNIEFHGLKINDDDKFNLRAEIPASGGEFSVISNEKNVKDAYVSSIWDEFSHKGYESDNNVMSPYFDSNTWIDGDWWKMEYLKIDNPYEIIFQIDPNPTKEERELRITFGCCYKLTNLTIIQAGSEE